MRTELCAWKAAVELLIANPRTSAKALRKELSITRLNAIAFKNDFKRYRDALYAKRQAAKYDM